MSGRDDESCDIMRYHATEAEAGRERVVYDVIRPKALRKRDEAAGAEGEAEAVPLTGSGSGLGAGFQVETIGRKKQGKKKEVAPQPFPSQFHPSPVTQIPQSAAHLMADRPADKWVWGPNLTPKDIQDMVRGSDRR